MSRRLPDLADCVIVLGVLLALAGVYLVLGIGVALIVGGVALAFGGVVMDLYGGRASDAR